MIAVAIILFCIFVTQAWCYRQGQITSEARHQELLTELRSTQAPHRMVKLP